MRKIIRSAASTTMLVFVLGTAHPVIAQDASFTLPAGLACPDLTLQVDITFAANRVVREFTDQNGNPVRLFEGGRGSNLLFTNVDTGATHFIMGNGSVAHTTFNLDGSSEVSSKGHNVLILFPSDLPMGVGPTTKQYIGRVDYSVGVDGTFTLRQVRGRTVDICAILSQ